MMGMSTQVRVLLGLFEKLDAGRANLQDLQLGLHNAAPNHPLWLVRREFLTHLVTAAHPNTSLGAGGTLA